MRLEFVNFVMIISNLFSNEKIKTFLLNYEDTIFSILAGILLFFILFCLSRNLSNISKTFSQDILEFFVSEIEDFLCTVIGKGGEKFMPFIATLFLYILVMNLFSVVPFFKAPTSNLSITLGIAICSFFYIQYTAIKELGFLGFIHHLSGNLKVPLLYIVVLPIFLFFLHILTELIRPITLALRLRSNIWGDDMVLAIFSNFGLKGLFVFLFNYFMTFLSSFIQATVFSILNAVFISMITKKEE